MRRLLTLIATAISLAPAIVDPAPAPELRFDKIIGDVRGMGRGNLSVVVTEDGTVYLLMRSGRVAVFGEDGTYRRSERLPLVWPQDNHYLAAAGNHVFLGDRRTDFPWLLSPRRQGTDPGRFRGAKAVAVDETGRVFVADAGNRRVQIFSANDNTTPDRSLPFDGAPTAVAVRDRSVAVVADGARLHLFAEGDSFVEQAKGDVGLHARAVALGHDGRVFVAYDGGPDRHQLKEFRVRDGAIEEVATIAPSYTGLWPDLFPDAVPLVTGPDGQVWFSAREHGKVLSLDPSSDTVRERVTGVRDPVGLAFDPQGRLHVGTRDARVLQFALPEGDAVVSEPVSETQSLYNDVNVPIWGLLPADDGSLYVRVVEQGYRRGWPAVTFKRVQPDGTAKTLIDFGSLFAVRTRFPPWEGYYAVEFDAQGNLAMCVHPMQAVLKVSLEGEVIWEASGQPRGGADAVDLVQVRDLALDSAGRIWVVDAGANQVVCLSAAGKLLYQYGTYANVDDTEGKGFDAPSGIAVTEHNGKEFLYVGDAGNQRLVKYAITR